MLQSRRCRGGAIEVQSRVEPNVVRSECRRRSQGERLLPPKWSRPSYAVTRRRGYRPATTLVSKFTIPAKNCSKQPGQKPFLLIVQSKLTVTVAPGDTCSWLVPLAFRFAPVAVNDPSFTPIAEEIPGAPGAPVGPVGPIAPAGPAGPWGPALAVKPFDAWRAGRPNRSRFTNRPLRTGSTSWTGRTLRYERRLRPWRPSWSLWSGRS